ncbi:MAG: hypothetical protein FJ109_09135 [Deltaproteobacteria bacterium]|nr:hypothetical protein [Deltaproteobacteria bacterium]
MGNRACLIVVALLVASVPLPAAAQDEKVKEPATGIEFACTGQDHMALLGVGVRKKMVFNVYAGALYVDGAALAKEVGGDGSAARVTRAVWTSGVPRIMLMHFVRDVPADKVREAFRESLSGNMTEDDYAGEKESIDEFLAGVVDVRKGDVFTFRTSGPEVVVFHGKKKIFAKSSRRLVAGMWGSWFGSKPVCPELRKNLVGRSAQVLGK